MLTYEKSLVEVREVLNHLPNEYYKKIPDKIINLIDENKNSYYSWNYDESKNFEEQSLSKEALAILAYIILNYLLNDTQKQNMEQLLRQNDYKQETKKKELYDIDIFKNKNKNKIIQQKEQITVETKSIVVQEQKWYHKIINFITKYFSNK